MWVTRDMKGYGGVRLWKVKPKRGNYYWKTKGGSDDYLTIDGMMFPNLKWEDEPLEIELVSKNDNAIVPKMMNEVQEKLAESVDDYFNYVGHVQDIHPYLKEQEQNYYNDMCWRWQDWNTIKYDHPSIWDLNFDDYAVSKRQK